MKCSEIRQRLQQIVYSHEVRMNDPQVAAHLQQCELCRQYCTDLQLKQRLRQVIIEEPSPGFIERSINKAVTSAPQPAAGGRYLNGGVLVVALVMALMVGFILLPDKTVPLQTVQHQLQMAVNQPRDISIVIDSEQPQHNARIKVSLAKNLRLKGYGDTTELSWETALSSGENVIQLPLVLQGNGGGYVEVSYQVGGQQGAVRITVSKA